MSIDIAQRHRGTLRDRFRDDRLPAKVTVEVAPETARSRTGQHLAWMVLNLLARQAGEIATIELSVPPGIAPITPLGPLVPASAGDLGACLRAGIAAINPTILGARGGERSRVAIRVGPGPLGEGDLAVATTAIGWSGYMGREPVDVIGADGNPIGAYLAACLCAGEVFKFVRGARPDAASPAQRLWLDGYRFAISGTPDETPELPPGVPLAPAIVAGVGAVGNAFLHVLYAVPEAEGGLTVIDGDLAGIEDTNLNRYVLFGHQDLDRQKASAAAALFAGRPLVVFPVDDSWERWVATQREPRFDLVISAVDKNPARHAIQDALPRLILSASTNEMRAQVNAYDVLNGGPCLRCRNRVEAPSGDDAIIAELRRRGAEERRAQAEALDVDPKTLEAFLADPGAHCGAISGETLRRFAGVAEEPEWSVGFVSALAGVLLAAEYLKHGGGFRPALDAAKDTFRFQFWHPEQQTVNRRVGTPPEANCQCQGRPFQRAIESLWGVGA